MAVALVAGCSGDDEAPEAGSRDAYCAELRVAIEEDLTVFDPLRPVAVEDTSAALDRLSTAAPPVLADDLALLADAFDRVTEVLAEVDPSDPAAADRLEALDLDLEAIAAAQLTVARYSLEECAIDLAEINAASVTTVAPPVPTLPPTSTTTLPVAPTTTPTTVPPG